MARVVTRGLPAATAGSRDDVVGRRRGIVRVGMVVVMTAISFLTGLVSLGWSRWVGLAGFGCPQEDRTTGV
jgi:hypothetical protein